MGGYPGKISLVVFVVFWFWGGALFCFFPLAI